MTTTPIDAATAWRALLAARSTGSARCGGVVIEAGRWRAAAPVERDAAARLDAYAPLLARPHVVAHLAQTLDGRIAPEDGRPIAITGPENLDHVHRLRALFDAIIVGASTAELDDPRLTARRVPGPHPTRVVLDPRRRLPTSLRVFSDGEAPTVLVCSAERARDGDRHGRAEVVGAPARDGRLDLRAVFGTLAARGLRSALVEGGGITVSRCLAAGVIDRLQIAVAPHRLGPGRPGVVVPRGAHLMRQGDDVLYDFGFTRR